MPESINIIHELTMLYLKNKDISSLSPSELFDEYKKVYAEIKACNSKGQSTNWFGG